MSIARPFARSTIAKASSKEQHNGGFSRHEGEGGKQWIVLRHRNKKQKQNCSRDGQVVDQQDIAEHQYSTSLEGDSTTPLV